MEFLKQQDDKNILVRWNYSHDEWRAFLRWKLLGKNFIYSFIHWFRPRQKRIPEVMITDNRVWIDNIYEPFQTDQRQLKRINIKDVGKINVMEITYEQQHLKEISNNDIRIPVPKGKLKEAIEVEEKLNRIRNINRRD